MKNFIKLEHELCEKCHDGEGGFYFKRVYDNTDFECNIDFIDHTVIPPNTTIGFHTHTDNEEIYFVLEGEGEMKLNDLGVKVCKGDIIVNKMYSSHSLINNGEGDIELLVIQVSK